MHFEQTNRHNTEQIFKGVENISNVGRDLHDFAHLRHNAQG